jgi:hypothetical protein
MSFGKQDFASPLPHALGQRAVGVFQTLVSLIFSTLGKGSDLRALQRPESMAGMNDLRGKYPRIKWFCLAQVIAVVICVPSLYREMARNHESLLLIAVTTLVGIFLERSATEGVVAHETGFKI